MTTYFVSDTFFDGAGPGRGCPGPEDRRLIDGWNAVVGDDDIVWHLGNFATSCSRQGLSRLMARLNGLKHLIAGPLDPGAVRHLDGWQSVQDYAVIRVEGRCLTLFHFPLRAWPEMDRRGLQLHGRADAASADLPGQVDVTLNRARPTPLSLAEVLDKAFVRRPKLATPRLATLPTVIGFPSRQQRERRPVAVAVER